MATRGPRRRGSERGRPSTWMDDICCCSRQAMEEGEGEEGEGETAAPSPSPAAADSIWVRCLLLLLLLLGPGFVMR